jgi:hypothetical protein
MGHATQACRPKKPGTHEQFKGLVDPGGAMELFWHAMATPLTQTTPTGQAEQPTTALKSGVRTNPERQTQPPKRLFAPGKEKVFGGHGSGVRP